MRALVLAMAIAACGRFHFDPLGGGNGDGAIGDGKILPCSGSSFGTPHPFPTGLDPWDVAAGDIDGDGRPDLAVMNDFTNGTTSILRNLGGGTFAAPAPIPATDDAQRVQLVDMTGDGVLDLVMEIGGEIAVRVGDGHGGFGAIAYYPANGAGFPDNFAIGDIDGDGHLDIAAVPLDSQSGVVLYGDGTGGFTSVDISVASTFPYWVETSDLDGDGKSDLVVSISNGSVNELQIMMATSTRGMFASTLDTTVGGGILAIADLDHDGHVDVVVDEGGTIAIVRGLGGSQFSAPTMAPLAAGSPSELLLVDVDGDGMLDLVATREGDNAVIVLHGNGDATFGSPVVYSVPGPNAVAVRDLDGDGHPDLAVADRGTNNVQIVLQTCTQ